jgi:hypothetical protein
MRRLALFCGLLLTIGLVAVIAWRTEPTSSGSAGPAAGPAAGATAAVTSVTRSCPPAPPGTGSAQVTMVAVPSQAAAAKGAAAAQTGSATLSAVPAVTAGASAGNAPAGKPVIVSAPGAVTTITVPGNAGQAGKTGQGGKTGQANAGATGGAEVAASGQMAEGFEAEQVDSAGMGLVSCTHAGSDMWFVGTGSSEGAPAVWLYLMNTAPVGATADVTILTDTGQQNGLDNAITVGPNQLVAENIAPFIHGSQALALHVQTSAGQVAASVWEGQNGGKGAWLPQAAAPATTLVIPGLTVASSAARLFVTVPGSTDAKLKVEAYTPAGASAQFATTPIDASASATTPVTLSSLGASAAGLELQSSVPIVAGVLVPGAGIGSFTTATAPVTEQGVVAGNPATRGLTIGLLLTAPAGAAQARITIVAAAGASSSAAPQTVTVPAGHTIAVAVPRPTGRDPFAIVLTPQAGSGPLYAVRVVTTGTGGLSAPVTSLLPVTSALTAITLPPVTNSYTAVLP